MTRPSRPDDAQAPPARTRGLDEARRLLRTKPGPKPISVKQGLRATAAITLMATFGLGGLAMGDTPVSGIFAPRSDIDIRIGRNAGSGRIEIYGLIGSRASVRRDKDQVVIRMPGQARPDLGDLRSNPPVGIAGVEVKSDSRASELWLKVSSGFDSHFGRADGAVYVQLDPKPGKEEPAKGKVSVNLQDLLKPEDNKPAAQAQTKVAINVPVIPIVVSDIDGGKDIAFAFPGPAAAAVFRRGDAIWVVFDTEADLRLPPDLKDGAIIQDAQWTHNDGFTALRITSTSASLSALNDGLVWRVRLGGRPLEGKASEVTIIRDDSSGVPALNVNMAGATKIAWIKDPSVGDRMAVIPARAPVKNLTTARTTLEATLASTAQGVAVVRMAPDIKVVLDGDLIEVSRPGGLSLSNLDPNATTNEARLEYKSARFPSLVNPDWSKTPPEGFLPRYNALQAAAAEEANGGVGASTKARLALARFLVGQGLTYEAQGALDLLARQNPRALEDPQVRGLRVAAKMLSGRYADATGDLASGQLIADPSAKLWAGYAEYKTGNFTDSVKDFAAGMKVIDQFPVEWRTRFATAFADAARIQKDMKTATAMIGYAVTQDSAPLDRLAAYLVNARIIEASGDKARALKVYQAVAKASDAAIATPAVMRAAMLSYQLNQADAAKTLASLDSLRYRWRGDDTELQVVADMGQIYLDQGRYGQALSVLKTASRGFANQPQAVQIQASLDQAFRNLFIGGMADGLQPVEALGLFYDNQDLVPQGSEGDLMVRRLVRRLVDVDLLDQAAQLLSHQVNERLEGVAKSDVAADLAAIYLMDHNPQKALQALWSTRTTLLPKTVLSQRAVLEARALNDLNEPDKALEVLGSDKSPDADDVRADIFWRQQDWTKVAALLEKQLGDRYKSDAPLTPIDESRLIRAGIAMSLLKDEKGLARLSGRFDKFAASAASPDALRVALAPMDGGTVSTRDFAAASAQTDSFSGWVSAMKKRFRQKADAPTGGQVAATPAKAKSA